MHQTVSTSVVYPSYFFLLAAADDLGVMIFLVTVTDSLLIKYRSPKSKIYNRAQRSVKTLETHQNVPIDVV